MFFRNMIRKNLRRWGLDIVRYNYMSHPSARKAHFLKELGITVVLDVGGNEGQYAKEIRLAGYDGRIVSFEPLSDAYAKLEKRTHSDKNWSALNVALGNEDGLVPINIAGNSQSSSILNMLPRHSDAAPESKYLDVEEVEVRKLGPIVKDICGDQDRIYLKIDAQGFEKKVLDGAEPVFSQIDLIQVEVALTPLYEGETLFFEMNEFLYEKGYCLVGIDPPAFCDSMTGEILQLDILYRKMLLNND